MKCGQGGVLTKKWSMKENDGYQKHQKEIGGGWVFFVCVLISGYFLDIFKIFAQVLIF